MTRRLVLRLAYDGSSYSGFVPQDNANTVGAELERALRHVDPHVGRLTCSSRTDAGVHASNQVVSCLVDKEIASRGWALALGQQLPDDISVRQVGFVPIDFDPRRDPIYKRYRYRLLVDCLRDPFWQRRVWRIAGPLDLALMAGEARDLVGEHDFAAFRQARDERTETRRKLHDVRVAADPSDARRIDLVVTGNRFLYNMVRIIAGTLVDVGLGRRPAGTIRRALSDGQRTSLGVTAPAAGLELEHVELATPVAEPWPVITDHTREFDSQTLPLGG